MKDKHYNEEEFSPCTAESGSPLIRIIICDDDDMFLSKLHHAIGEALRQNNVSAKIHTYSSMEDIGQPILSSCDIAFLDIDFQGKKYNGIDIARRLREVRKDAVIIFVTNYIEYAPEGYEVNAFRYVLKNEISRKLPICLPEALAQLRAERENMKIQNGGELIDIPLAEILYMESQQHTIIIRTPQKAYRCYNSLTSLEKELEAKGFLRIHNSYLVNMAHLVKYQSQEAVLSDGTTLRVSARSYAVQKQKYLLWKGRL